MKQTTTNRGFGLFEFEDLYGEKCTLQASSLACTPAIWLGTEGRVALEGAHVISRMHLDQALVRELLPALQYFAEHGELPPVGNPKEVP